MSAAEQLPLVPGFEATAKASRARPHAHRLLRRALEVNGVPMLVEEMAKATHLPLSSVAARVGELLRRGELLPAVFRETSTGRKAWAYALPALLVGEARQRAEGYAKHLIARRGRWQPSDEKPAKVSGRVLVVEAEGEAAVSAAVKLAGEILGT